MNDWLLKINDVDLTNKDKKQVIKAVLNGGGVINMVVRRRKSLGGKVVTPLHISLSGHKGEVLVVLPGQADKYAGIQSVFSLRFSWICSLVCVSGFAISVE